MEAKFEQEASIDAGGPYREALSNIADELFSNHLPLMIPTPNNKAETGFGRDLWTLNPDANSKNEMGMYDLFGWFLGFSARSCSAMEYKFTPVFWKKLLNEKIELEDFRLFDTIMINQLEQLKQLKEACSPEDFDNMFA